MNDDQLLRYSRHILLPQIGIEGQERLLAAHALVIGAGGLGSPVALYLASAGVGRLTICDGDDGGPHQSPAPDRAPHARRSGMEKAESARATLAGDQPGGRGCRARRTRGREAPRRRSRAAADIVLDCSDNFVTRHAVNRACVRHGKPLVSGAGGALRRPDGGVRHAREGLAVLPCLFPEHGETEDVRCAVMGVFAPLTGIVGSIQAAEALKLLAGAGRTLAGRLLLLDALTMQVRTIRLEKDPACPVCATG